MSSPLAFDKQAKPLTFHRRTKQLRVRLFRNPAARGTCSQVLDDEGNPLYVDVETDYPDFRKLVGAMPGLYRLDQCDDDGNEVEDAPPAYVTIDPPRNAQTIGTSTDEVSALAVIREMAAVQREMAAIQGQALKALADNHALILASAADVMRAPRPAPAPAPAELRNAADDTNEEEDEDEIDDEEMSEDAEEEPTSSGAVGLLTQLVKMIDPKDARKLGSWLMAKYMQFRHETAAAPQSAPPTNIPSPAPVSVAAAPSGPVATTAQAEQQVVTPVVTPPPPTVLAPETSSTDATPTAEPPQADPESTESQVTGQVPQLTQEQLVHIAMINAQLSNDEQVVAEQVMRRMTPATMQRWLIALSAMSVEEATAAVREAITERQQQRNKPTR